MNKIKLYLDNLMAKMKKENPDANWANLLTGVGILVLVAIFSVWYFGNTDGVEVNDNLIDQMEQNEGDVASTTTGPNGEIIKLKEGETAVQAGEGLWHVAKRVCNDPEKYNYLAAANGMTIWSKVAEGQVLVIDCGGEKL